MQALYVYLVVGLIILLSALTTRLVRLIDKNVFIAVLELILVWPIALPLFICYFIPYILVWTIENLIEKIEG